ncbi:hypothetical protein [Pseudomonas shahriarae]|uniref:hypothetical protein n=1 Tax=Pseudomonas shahriarae TaxID=2745512 RepID=UPI00249CEE1B|nr:hypothetical protein [Pseudomonas shahriarae]MDI3201599.1 hypothetical protein [Pseudomonas shahriarae]
MDRVVGFGCVLLVLFGAFLFSAVGNPELKVKDVFEVLSYVATMVMAFFAWQALSAWKRQKRLEALQQLREGITGLTDGARYLHGLRMAHIDMHQVNDRDVLDDHAETLKTLKHAWRKSHDKFCPLWNAYGHFMKDIRPFEFQFDAEKVLMLNQCLKEAEDQILRMGLGIPGDLYERLKDETEVLVWAFGSSVSSLERSVNECVASMIRDI